MNRNALLFISTVEYQSQPPITNSLIFPSKHRNSCNQLTQNFNQLGLKHSPINRHDSEKGFKRFQQPPRPQMPAQRVHSPEEMSKDKRMPTSKQGKSKPYVLRGSAGRNNNPLKETSSTSSTQGPGLNKGKSAPTFIKNYFKTKASHRHRQRLAKQNFRLIRLLGEGKFGTVYLAQENETGMVVGLKVVQKKRILRDNFLGQFIRELKIQSCLDHPNIIKVYGFFHDQQHFYIVLQLGCDGQLFDVISQKHTLSEQSTSFVVGNLLDALRLMHSKKILHRDIKPENIVLVHGNVKLCDFGWAVNKKQELRSTFCGTPLYLSPELLQGARYDEKVDLWAVGVLAYEMYFGTSPFDVNDHDQLFKIVTEQVVFPKNKPLSSQFKEFLLSILQKNPKQRLTSDELLSLAFIRKYRDLQTCEQLCH